MATFRKRRSRKYRNKNTRRKSRNARKSNIKRRGKKSLRGGGGGILGSLFGKKPPETTPTSKVLTPQEKTLLITTIDNNLNTIEAKKKKLLDIQDIPVPLEGTISEDFQRLRDLNTRNNIINNYNIDTKRYFNRLKTDLETVSTDVINNLSEVYAIVPNAIDNNENIHQLLPEVNYDKISVSFDALYPPRHEERDVVTLSQAKKFNEFITNIYNKNIKLLKYLKIHLE